jgi:hypothetical protein
MTLTASLRRSPVRRMSEKLPTAPPLENPLEDYRTDTTARGYRLGVIRFRGYAILTCECEAMLFDKDQRVWFTLGRIVVLDAQVRAQAEDFARHCFAFYDEELAKAAVDAVRKISAALKEPSAAPAAAPPRGIAN